MTFCVIAMHTSACKKNVILCVCSLCILVLAETGHESAIIEAKSYNITDYNQSFKKGCMRYAFVDGRIAGLGHMYSTVVLTSIFALENDAVPLIDKRKFKNGGHVHRAYPWSLEKLGLDKLPDIRQTKRKLRNLKEIRQSNWTSYTKLKKRKCNILFRTCEKCCYIAAKRRHCIFIKERIFSRASTFFRKLRHSSNANEVVPELLQKIRSLGYIDVVWHIREGDISLHVNVRKDFVSNLLQTIQKMFANTSRKIKVVVLSEKAVEEQFYFKKFESIGATFLNVNVEESLELMIHTAILVTSGSSFTALATMLKTTESISFQVSPKEGNISFYDIYEQPFVNEFGEVTSHSISELKSRGEIIMKNIGGK